MKKQLFALTVISLLLWNCNNSTKKETKTEIKKETKVMDLKENPLLGSWTRSFKMSAESTATVNYTFWKDSLQYEMLGPMNMKYMIKKDTFLIHENRWIGTKNNDTYVIFIKDNTKKQVTLLKMKSPDLNSAIKMPFPSDSARSKFSSWNTFNKK